MNLDSQVNSLEAVATLAAACKGTPSLVTLSLRYCALPDDALDALVELVKTNVNLETLYLHGTVHEAWKDALTEVWHARGAFQPVWILRGTFVNLYAIEQAPEV